MPIETFLSYSHKNRQLAAKIKDQLEPNGFSIFMAHEDIAPSAEWQDVILRKLNTCRVFVALLTVAFDGSHWTHQEIGIAYARKPSPIMVPINAGRKPAGFLGRFQAVTLDGSNAEDVCLQITKSVASKKAPMARVIRKALIEQVGRAKTFDSAGSTLSTLAAIDGLTAVEINELLESASSNDQVYGSGSASRYLRRLIARHKKGIKRDILKRLYRVWSYK